MRNLQDFKTAGHYSDFAQQLFRDAFWDLRHPGLNENPFIFKGREVGGATIVRRKHG